MALRQFKVEIGLWPVITAVALGTASWMTMAGLAIDWQSALLPSLATLGLQSLAAFYTDRRPDLRLAATLSGAAQLVSFSAVAACLSYAAASTGGPLWDGTLLSWDGALGLDWRAYLAFVNARPWLGSLYTLAYQSLEVQLLIVLAVLGFGGRIRELRTFLSAFIIAALATILISGVMPAMAMFSFLKLQPPDFPNLRPAAAYVHVAIVDGLRHGTLRTISLAHMEGIITFPSFHAVLGVLVTLALWPVRWIRWPALLLNGLLIAATPIDGGHYFVDVMAGGVIAWLSARVAAHLTAETGIRTVRTRATAASQRESGTGAVARRPAT